MSDTVIRVEGLGKKYQIGLSRNKYDGLRHSLESGIRNMGQRLRGRGSKSSPTQDFWALKEVSFKVKRGECVGVIGRNGAGKSTLLKLLSRITEPTTGEIGLRGRVGSLLEVGTGFHQELSGRENIYLNGAVLGMSRKEIARKFDEIVAFSEVEKFLDTPVKRYSSGMYVRLAFAVAAHLEPEILIVDEVLAVGDSVFQQKCLGKMDEVASGGRTILFVSHNLAVLRTLCKTCCFMNRGELTFNGPIDEGIQKYMSFHSSADLESHRTFTIPDPDRPGMKSATIVSNNSTNGQFQVGDRLTLTVEFNSKKPIRHPKLGYLISDDQGRPLVNANNRFLKGSEPELSLSAGVIQCDLGLVPLLPGRYFISLWFGNHTQDSHHVESALSFDMIEHDYWGSGILPTKGASPLWWPTQFTITNNCVSTAES